MKFLIALSILATSSAFAQRMDHDKWVKCYDTAQGSDMEVVYKMKKHDHYINLVYPRDLAQQLEVRHDCLVSSHDDSTETSIDNRWIKFCPTDGQRVNGLVPVDVTYNQDEETVYCEKEIVKWIKWGQPDLY